MAQSIGASALGRPCGSSVSVRAGSEAGANAAYAPTPPPPPRWCWSQSRASWRESRLRSCWRKARALGVGGLRASPTATGLSGANACAEPMARRRRLRARQPPKASARALRRDELDVTRDAMNST